MMTGTLKKRQYTMEVSYNKRALYLFDFCDTLVSFQTANSYVQYVKKKKDIQCRVMDFIVFIVKKIKLNRIIKIFLHNNMSLDKFILLYELKGISYEEMDLLAKEFYEKRIKKCLNKQIIDELLFAKSLGCTIGIISGGYDIYIKYFAKEFDIPIVISSELNFFNGFFSGKLKNKDCMGEEKVKKLLMFFNTRRLHNLFTRVVGYSDSDSDLPFLSLCDEKYVVLREKKEVSQWIKCIDAKIIRV